MKNTNHHSWIISCVPIVFTAVEAKNYGILNEKCYKHEKRKEETPGNIKGLNGKRISPLYKTNNQRRDKI